MSDDTVATGRVTGPGNGDGQAGVAGWTVPGYTELKALGSGGFGDVVLARHNASGILVAIKYLHGDLLADSEFAGMFRSEATVLGSLDDPNIVRLYEYVESPSGAAIVMELIDGVTLREILTHQGRTTPEAALVVLQGSLLGLAAAHQRGVVHRDYKPENVLVNGDGISKLTDFGIAARAGDHPVPAGTLQYAAPEQMSGASATPASDVYAATATFFECLAGRPPFTGESTGALLFQHYSEPVPLEPVPEPLRPLVAAGMAKDPKLRPSDANTLVAALKAAASGAYGKDWERRGRSHLGEAALLLAALWPSGGPAAVQGATVERIPLRQRNRRPRLRHFGAAKAAIAVAAVVVVAAAGTALAAGLTRHGSTPPVTLPAVTRVSPADGTTTGGSTLTITGTGVADATVVRFGGVAGKITADSGTQITVTSPPSTGTVDISVTAAAITADSGMRITRTSPPGTGTVDITVTTPVGTSKPTAADHYTYTAPRPAVTGVSPNGGSTAGRTTVSITGTGLAGATGVRFGAAAAAITADSNTQITVTSPPGTGTVDITVTTPAGTSKPTAADHYTYATRPKKTESISFTAPASGTAGGSATLSATGGGSGNPVVFSVDPASGPGVCTVSGATVTYAAAGPCVIDANQAGTGNYAAAPQVQRMITVNGRSESISFTAPASGTAGGSATLSATGGGSGNPVVFSVDPASGAGVCTVSGATVTFAAAGSCVVDANQAGTGSYAAAPQVQQTITVSSGQKQSQKQSQSISFTAPASGTAGGSATLSATGGGSGNPVVFSVDPASAAGVCTVSGATVSYAAAGACVIDANQAGSATYAAAPQVQGTIRVGSAEKLSQSISFTAPATGTADSSATLSATGGGSGNPVVFSVDPASAAGVCTVSGATVSYAAAGACVIDANQAGSATYAAAPQVQGTIRVGSAEKLSQSISFTAPATGTADSSATLSATGGGSGNPVVFSVDPASAAGVCTVSGATVSYAAAGACVIDANQAGSATYAAAPQVQGTIRVGSAEKLSQSISFTAPATGTADSSATLSATGGGSGNPVVFSVDPASAAGVCTVSGATVSYAAAGACVIDANQAGSATYAAAPQVQGTIRVGSAEKLSQSISFTAPATGTADSSATLSATGGGSGNPVVFSVDPASAAGVCTVSGATVSYAAAGACVIDANQAGSATYAAAPQVQQTITVSVIIQLLSLPAPDRRAGLHQQLTTTSVDADPVSGPRTCSVTVSDALPWPWPLTGTVTYTGFCPAATGSLSGWGGCRSGRVTH